MQDSASENERMALANEREEKDVAVATFIRLLGFALIFTVAFSMYRIWDDDELRLHWLHAVMRILQEIARVVGMWALEFEQAYNEFANSLH